MENMKSDLPNLTGTSVKLRALEPSDVDLLYQWENDCNLWFVSNTLTPFSRFVLEQYVINAHDDIYTAKQLRLMIDIVQDGQRTTIGTIDLFDFDPRHLRAGIGIMIHENYREKGYASDALETVISYAFNALNLHQLYCNISSDNQRSLDLFQKHHFKIIGLKKDWLLFGKKYFDEYMLQLVNG